MPAPTPVAATLSTALPVLAVEVSRVIPDCGFELCLVNTKSADPPVELQVPLVTVTVSEAILPNVVVTVELDNDAEGGSLMRIVTVKVALTLFESVAVNV